MKIQQYYNEQEERENQAQVKVRITSTIRLTDYQIPDEQYIKLRKE
jgi:hypothetical protein